MSSREGFRYPLEEIKERCDLVEVISAHVALKKSGANSFLGLCPFHNEKTPSFNVNAERGVWKCFGCGEGGDVISFVQKIDGLTFRQAVEQLARKAGITIERSEAAARQYSERERLLRANNLACTFFRRELAESKKAAEYLRSRGLSGDAVNVYKLGYAPDSWDGLLNYLREQRVDVSDAVKAGLVIPRENSSGFYDRFRDRLIFPIADTMDRIIAFGGRAFGDENPKYLNSPETALFSKTRTLYGLNIARKGIAREDRVLVVEGYMDVIAAQCADFDNTVATLGTALTEEHVSVLSRFTKNVILGFDSDSAGMNAVLRSAPIFEKAGFRVRVISMPKGEDPDSMLKGGDVSRFSGLVQNALPVADYRIKCVLSEYDLQSDEGKSEALAEAVGILVEVNSDVERERLIRFLAKYHPNFSTGTTLAEDHLRNDVARRRRKTLPPTLAENRSSAQSGRPKPALSLVERSERLLLQRILFSEALASKVFEGLAPNEFTGSETRALAEALSKQCSELGKIDQEDLRTRIEGSEAEGLLLDLLVDVDGSETVYSIDDLLRVIIDHKKNERLARMRDLAARAESGTIKLGDADYEEFMQLVRDTSGPWRR
ncbi:MAG: DNA primase [Armatimonadota bacterium]